MTSRESFSILLDTIDHGIMPTKRLQLLATDLQESNVFQKFKLSLNIWMCTFVHQLGSVYHFFPQNLNYQLETQSSPRKRSRTLLKTQKNTWNTGLSFCGKF